MFCFQDGVIKDTVTGECLTMNFDRKVVLANCSATDIRQKWSFDKAFEVKRLI